MIEDLKALLRQKYGDDPLIDKIIDELYKGSGITDPTARTFVIGTEFFQMMKTSGRTARDIELELSAKYPILSASGVWKVRRRFVRGGKRKKAGYGRK